MPVFSLNLLVQTGTVVSVLVAAGSILANVQMAWRQMNVQVFTTYASRFEQIMSDFPGHAYGLRFCLTDELPPRSEELSLCLLRYLNLCSEEFYLRRTGYLDRKVWRIWEREIVRTLSTPMVRREWPHLASEFDAYPEFARFVRHAQAGGGHPDRAAVRRPAPTGATSRPDRPPNEDAGGTAARTD